MIRNERSPAVEVGRSYGAVLAVAALLLLMAVAIDPTERSIDDQAIGATSGIPTPIEDGPTVTTPDGEIIAGPTATTPGGSGRGGGGKAPGVRSACGTRPAQVPGDPYSPPCIAFSGDNGGSTHRGVTGDEIVVAVRQLEGPSAAQLFSELSGKKVLDSKEAARETIVALAEYFSKRFQFYGRKIKIVFYDGQGVGASELLGGGQERALADAVRVSDEIKAFADISAVTTPYANALSRQKVVNLGAPYPTRQWFIDRRPYAWSLFPDGTTAVDGIATWMQARLRNKQTVEFSPQFKGQPRVYGVVGPDNPEYGDSGDRFYEQLDGFNVAVGAAYRLDINSMPNQASNIIAQLKDAGVTTVVCACDPVMLALGMTPKANEQNYSPEWITGGLAFMDQDMVAQLVDDDQWQHSFGLAFNAEQESLGRSFPRAAFRSVRPGQEPAFGVEEMYYQMYILAIGLQMAGPNLNPQTFEAGMFAYPGGRGPKGTWTFSPTDFTTVDDFREIWWDRNRISVQNGEPGAWVELNGGARWNASKPPSGPDPYFVQP